MIQWSSSSNLGDCVWQLHFLMTMGNSHTLWVKPEYIMQLAELARGSGIEVKNVWERPENTTDFWIANGMLQYRGIHFYNQCDIVGFLFEWFNHLGGHCGMPRPVYPDRQSMLWRSESILQAPVRDIPLDVLIINSPPTSGQCPGYDHGEVCRLGQELRENGLYVLFTNWEGETPYTITEIAKLSIRAKLIIEVANGPAFPSHNIWNTETDRIILLSPMFLDYQTGARHLQASNAAEARKHCVELGWL